MDPPNDAAVPKESVSEKNGPEESVPEKSVPEKSVLEKSVPEKSSPGKHPQVSPCKSDGYAVIDLEEAISSESFSHIYIMKPLAIGVSIYLLALGRQMPRWMTWSSRRLSAGFGYEALILLSVRGPS